MYPLCVGIPQIPLSYTQICTPYAFGSPQVPLSYTQICTPYAFGSPQVPLSYTQICTPMRLVHLRYLFRIPKYVPPMRWFTSGTSFVYPSMYPLCVGSPQVPLSYTQVYTPYALVHLRYLFRIPKYVHPMRLVHLRYLFRIPKYVPPYAFGSPRESLSYTQICTPMRWFTSGTSFVYPSMYPLCVGSPQVPLSYTQTSGLSLQVCTPYAFGSPQYLLSYYLFQIPLSYTQICTPYAFGSPQVTYPKYPCVWKVPLS